MTPSVAVARLKNPGYAAKKKNPSLPHHSRLCDGFGCKLNAADREFSGTAAAYAFTDLGSHMQTPTLKQENVKVNSHGARLRITVFELHIEKIYIMKTNTRTLNSRLQRTLLWLLQEPLVSCQKKKNAGEFRLVDAARRNS